VNLYSVLIASFAETFLETFKQRIFVEKVPRATHVASSAPRLRRFWYAGDARQFRVRAESSRVELVKSEVRQRSLEPDEAHTRTADTSTRLAGVLSDSYLPSASSEWSSSVEETRRFFSQQCLTTGPATSSGGSEHGRLKASDISVINFSKLQLIAGPVWRAISAPFINQPTQLNCTGPLTIP